MEEQDDLVVNRAAVALQAVRAGQAGAAASFDEILYPLALAYVKRRGRFLVAQAANQVENQAMRVPLVSAADADQVAHDVAVEALQTARDHADRFDPAKGNAVAWVLGACPFAYINVVRRHAGGRGLQKMIPVDEETLEDASDRYGTGVPQPQASVAESDKLERALATLTDEERRVLLAIRRYGLTRLEVAAAMYNCTDQQSMQRVAATLRRATRRMQRVWETFDRHEHENL